MKLTKQWKEDAIKKILKNKTQKETDLIEKEFVDFGTKFIENKNKKYQSEIDRLPKEYFTFQSSIDFSYGDGYKEHSYIRLNKSYAIPNNNKHGKSEIKLEGKEKTTFLIIIKKNRDLKKFKTELKTELFTVIMPCTTDKMILKVFPEIENYVALPKKDYPVAIQTDKLKRLLKS